MMASLGNTSELPPDPAAALVAAAVPAEPAAPPAKKAYRKPMLKPLGLLRSVTGSDIVF